MAELKLNIYAAGKVEKTYVTDTFGIMYGTVEDLIAVIDMNKLDDKMELGKMVLKVLPMVKPFLKDIFVGLTDDELRRTKVNELVPIFVDVFRFTFDEIAKIGGGDNSKN